MRKLVIALFALAVAGCSRSETPQSSTTIVEAPALPAGMSRVTDASQVCMINDQFMGRAQIPVVVDGRTYYGCCPACKEKLEKQPGTRFARDPVTNEEVDKATAIIVQDAEGKVLYFTSEGTLRRYRG